VLLLAEELRHEFINLFHLGFEIRADKTTLLGDGLTPCGSYIRTGALDILGLQV
jgi:hypothetical protein